MRIFDHTIRRPDFLLSEQALQARRAREQQHGESLNGSMLVRRNRPAGPTTALPGHPLASRASSATRADSIPRRASLIGISEDSKRSDSKVMPEVFTPDSPVREVPRQDILRTAHQLADQITDWRSEWPVERSADPDVENWNRRLKGAFEVADRIALNARFPHRADRFLAYFVNEVPVAMANFRGIPASSEGEPAHLYVRFLAAHPGSRTAGATLMESMVDHAAATEADGRIKVEIEEEALAAYVAMGFSPLSWAEQQSGATGREKLVIDKSGAIWGSESNIVDWHMYLDPALSDKWIRSGSRWQLKSNVDARYIHGLLPDPGS